MIQMIDDLITKSSNEELLDVINPIRFCDIPINANNVLALYKVKKEDTHQCQRENQDWFTKTMLDHSKWYFLLNDVVALYSIKQHGYDFPELKEATAFLKYHSRFKGVLENSYFFQALKLNLDESKSFLSKELKSFEIFSLFYDNDEVDMVTNKAVLILSKLTAILYFQSFTNYIYI